MFLYLMKLLKYLGMARVMSTYIKGHKKVMILLLRKGVFQVFIFPIIINIKCVN